MRTSMRAPAGNRYPAAGTRAGSAVEGRVVPERPRRWSAGRRLRWLVRREWRRDRLQLAGLEPTSRRLMVVVLVAFALNVGLAVVLASGLALPGGSVDVPGNFVAEDGPVTLPVLPTVVALLSAAMLAAGFTGWALEQGVIRRRLALAGVGIVGLWIWGPILEEIKAAEDVVAAGFVSLEPLPGLMRLGGTIAVPAAVAVIAGRASWLRRGIGPLLAAVPAVAALLLLWASR